MKESEKQEKTGLNADAVMKEVLKEQKANLFATVSEYIEDKTKVGELQEIINAALESAYNLGEMSETAATKGDEIIANMGNLFNNVLNPANSKYKQLYDNQRMAVDCLLQALRLQQVQLSIHETPDNLAQGLVSSLFNPSVLEKQTKE